MLSSLSINTVKLSKDAIDRCLVTQTSIACAYGSGLRHFSLSNNNLFIVQMVKESKTESRTKITDVYTI